MVSWIDEVVERISPDLVEGDGQAQVIGRRTGEETTSSRRTLDPTPTSSEFFNGLLLAFLPTDRLWGELLFGLSEKKRLTP